MAIKSKKPFYAIIAILLFGCILLLIENQSIDTSVFIDDYNTDFIDDNSVDTVQNIQNLHQIHDCWSHLFIKIFVKKHLFYDFNITKYPNNCNKIETEISSIPILLQQTLPILSSLTHSNFTSSNYSFHRFIALRRWIMILFTTSNIKDNNNYYRKALELFNKIETNYNNKLRYNYPFFNIHLPRSGGTTICRWFKSIHDKQKINALSHVISEKRVKLETTLSTNCNVGDGYPFSWYGGLKDEQITPKTCQQQYEMMGDYNFVAREAPIYNNKNDEIFHAQLCDKFIYILSFRSPIERVISFLRSYERFLKIYINGTQKTNDISDFKDFFYYLFSKETDDNFEIMNDDKNIKYKLDHYTNLLYKYGNNAITRWLGYQYKKKIKTRLDIIQSFDAERKEINYPNDIHFYNAINNLFQIDFVLNFASYPDDISSIIANKKGDEFYKDNLMLNEYTKMIDSNNNNSMWNIFAKFANKYYNMEWFTFDNILKQQKATTNNWKPIEMAVEVFSDRDWKSLYNENYWDFKLYSMAKWIQMVDAKFYNHFG